MLRRWNVGYLIAVKYDVASDERWIQFFYDRFHFTTFGIALHFGYEFPRCRVFLHNFFGILPIFNRYSFRTLFDVWLLKVPGAIFYGIVLTAILGLVTNLIPLPDSIISMAPSLEPTFGVGVANMGAIVTDPQMWAVVVIFFLVAFFDTAGTLIGLAQQAGIMQNGKMPRIGKALMADSLSMLGGAVMGTTPTAAYVESSAGIAVGARTGLTAIVVAILFGFSMIFSPLLSVVTAQVTAPALIIIGVLMTSSLREIHWDQFETAFPAFLVIIGMPLTFNISYGIAFGFLFYPILMTIAGRRKELNPLIWVMFVLFLILLYTLTILKF